MFRIVVVEDDRIIRKTIIQSNWAEINAEIVGEAADGQQALEVIRETKPQLVITDINMPFMDGIELANQIRKEKIDTRIVFLTGYDDFRYLHGAILVKSDDYLLKPIQMPDLLQTAKKALEVWSENHQKREQLEESLPLLHEKFLSQLLYSSRTTQATDIQNELFRLQIFLTGPAFAVININIPSYKGEMSLYQLARKWNLSGEIEVLSFRHQEVFILLSLETDDGELLSNLEQGISLALEEDYHLSAYFSHSSIYPEMQDLETAVMEAKIRMEKMKIENDIEIRPSPLLSSFPFESEQDKENNTNRSSEKVRMHTIYQLVSSHTLHLEEAKRVALQMVLFLASEINARTKDEEQLTDIYPVTQHVFKANNHENLKKILEPLFIQWFTLKESQKEQSSTNPLVNRAIIYMQEHYCDSDLSLVKLAQEIHVSAPYLSNLFKVEKNINFTEYLLQLRMEQAKKLLKNTEKKTYEIAEEIGFLNSHYFSSCFKKYTGQTALSFRKE